MSWNERVCGQEVEKGNTTVLIHSRASIILDPQLKANVLTHCFQASKLIEDLNKPWTITAEGVHIGLGAHNP